MKDWIRIGLGLLIGGAFLLALTVATLEALAATGYLGGCLIFAVIVFVVGMIADSQKPGKYDGPRSNYLGTAYPTNWSEISRQARQRDGNQCGNCNSVHDLHVHHIIPLSKGGTSSLSNLRTLCKSCHGKLHPHMKID